jgi:hypothetical protein
LQVELPATEIIRHPFCSVFQHSEKFTSMYARPCIWHLRLMRLTGADASFGMTHQVDLLQYEDRR